MRRSVALGMAGTGALLLVVVLVLAGAGLRAAWRARGSGGAAVTELGDDGAVPAFALVERSGRSVGLADLAGRPWVADFIFTRCTGTCPLLSSRMFAVQQALGGEEGAEETAAPDVQLVSFSVDPDYDTPAVLAAYAERFKADSERWWFLTGERQALYALIVDGFHLGVQAASDDAVRAGSELITHSTRLVLVDRAGHIRGYYNAIEEDAVARLLADLRALEREPAAGSRR